MAAAPRRPNQVVDNSGRPLTSFAEGMISRFAVPDDGHWHQVPSDSFAVRLHVWPSRKGVLYTTSKAAAVVEGDARDEHLQASLPLAAGAVYLVTSNEPFEIYVCADPDTNGAAPLVGVVQSAAGL